MGRVLPILFNTGMVRAILDGNKTATRRRIKNPPHPDMPDNHNYCRMQFYVKDHLRTLHYMDVTGQNPFSQTRYFESLAPYDKGDILYVRETWAFLPCVGCMDGSGECGRFPGTYADREAESEGCFVYRADYPRPERINWSPSIHMPKEAARIWLKVTDVRVERLHDMTLDDLLSEGVVIRPEAFNDPDNAYQQARSEFARIWDSTIQKSQTDLNPWVWAIEFERCEKVGQT